MSVKLVLMSNITRYMRMYMSYKQVDSLLQWGATVLTLVGAVLTAAAVDPLNVYCLNAGTILWLIWAVRIRSASLIAVNAGLAVIYAGGIVRALLS